jgi:hypothetical protein
MDWPMGVHFLASIFPNWTPLDLFLRGSVKDVYLLPMPITLSSLKNQIQTATSKNDQVLLQDAWHLAK